MKVEFAESNPLYIEWEYSKQKKNKTTKCRIVEKFGEGEYVTIASGVAKCHKDDKFNKELSRKLSLERALDGYAFTKEHRGTIWNTYWATQTNKMNKLK